MIIISDYQNVLRECYHNKLAYKNVRGAKRKFESMMKNGNTDTLADCCLNYLDANN